MISTATVYNYTNRRWGKNPQHKRLLSNLLKRLEALHGDVNMTMLERICRHIELEFEKNIWESTQNARRNWNIYESINIDIMPNFGKRDTKFSLSKHQHLRCWNLNSSTDNYVLRSRPRRKNKRNRKKMLTLKQLKDRMTILFQMEKYLSGLVPNSHFWEQGSPYPFRVGEELRPKRK